MKKASRRNVRLVIDKPVPAWLHAGAGSREESDAIAQALAIADQMTAALDRGWTMTPEKLQTRFTI